MASWNGFIEDSIICPHCEDLILISWTKFKRPTTLLKCPKCGEDMLIRASVVLHEILPVRPAKPGEEKP
jgi:NAD-dependent SIR2 family protein deacetylase